MQKSILFLFIFSISISLSSQIGSGGYNQSNYGTRNYNSGINSFKYGIIGSNQDATGSPVGLVSAIIRREFQVLRKFLIDLVLKIYL